MNKIKKNNGVTLIALVITVIVLIILAGVSIGTLIGNDNNGVVDKAKEARTGAMDADEQNKIIVAWGACYSLYGSKIDMGKLKAQLINNGYDVEAENIEDKIVITFNDTNNKYSVDLVNGKVEKYTQE